MNNEVKLREPGKRAFPSRVTRPKLVLVPPQEPSCPDVRTELSREVKEMLREMNRRHAAKGSTDAPDTA